MNAKLTAIAMASLLTGGALAVAVLQPAPTSLAMSGGVATSGKASIGGPFQLTDHTGKRVTDQDYKGRYLLVFFGYTFCPDICPSGLQVIATALDQLGPDGDKITPVFITIDPERDTAAKLAAYVASFHPRLVGLTGSPVEVAAAIKAYRVFASKVRDERDPSSYTLDHSSIAYLMGPDGTLVAFAPDVSKAETVVSVLRKGLAGKS
jgi:protein SCO1